MTRLTDNVVTNGLSVDGFTASIATGAMNAGDSFLIRPTANAARDIAVMTTDRTNWRPRHLCVPARL